jgi:glycosyltransferase involved in cell wall biosynthesis
MKQEPLISIVIPCYNHGVFLPDALQSLINQTYQNWEGIIVNDGSIDNTLNIAEEWLLKDKRLKYLEQKNRGVVEAKNYGIKEAKGTFILPLDADDWISSDYISLAIEAFGKNKNLKLVYCKVRLAGIKNEEWKLTSFNLEKLALNNMIFNSAVFLKKDWNRIGGYDKNMKSGNEDWEFWINLLKGGGEVYQIPKICFYYRIREHSRNKKIDDKIFDELFKYMNKKHIEFYINEFGDFKDLIKRIKKLEVENKKLVLENATSFNSVKKMTKGLRNKLKRFFNGYTFS